MATPLQPGENLPLSKQPAFGNWTTQPSYTVVSGVSVAPPPRTNDQIEKELDDIHRQIGSLTGLDSQAAMRDPAIVAQIDPLLRRQSVLLQQRVENNRRSRNEPLGDYTLDANGNSVLRSQLNTGYVSNDVAAQQGARASYVGAQQEALSRAYMPGAPQNAPIQTNQPQGATSSPSGMKITSPAMLNRLAGQGLSENDIQRVGNDIYIKPTSKFYTQAGGAVATTTMSSNVPSAETSAYPSPQVDQAAAQSGTDSPSGVDTSGWSQPMKDAFDALKGYIDTNKAQGKIINPDIQISPEITQKFMDQAKTELGPYYKQLFSQAQQDLESSFKQIQTGAAEQERQLGQQYGKAVENTQESFARRGLEFSSERQKSEQQLADEAKQGLQQTAEAAQSQAERVGRQGERQLGSSFFGQILPQLSNKMTAGTTLKQGPGQYGFNIGAQSRQLFTPTGGTTGELERNQMMAEQTRKNELTANERSLRSQMYL